MTAPFRSAYLGGHFKRTQATVLDGDTGPGPFSTTLAVPLWSGSSDPNVVLVLEFFTAVNASGILPQVTSISGGTTGLTWHRYIDPHQDSLVPGDPSGVGQIGVELWWASSADPVPSTTSFTVTFDPPLSHASNEGTAGAGGSVFSGCLSLTSPWDPRLDLPASLYDSPSTPQYLSYDLTNGGHVDWSDGVYGAHIIYVGSALVGTDNDELAVVLSARGGLDWSQDTSYLSGWTDTGFAGGSGGAGVPDLEVGLPNQEVDYVPPPDGVIDNTFVAILLPGQLVFWGLNLAGPTGSEIGGTDNDVVVDVGPATTPPGGGGGTYSGPSTILFTGLAPGVSDLDTPIAGPGQIIFAGRKTGAIFVRYRDTRTPSFFAVELDVHSPDGGAETLRVSDIGYRSRAGDSIGLQVYPSVLDMAFDIDRHLGLEPGAASSAGFGSIMLHNVGQRYDDYTLTRNSDSRNVAILVGNKSTDSNRGVLVDPPYAELRPFFGGAALPWTLSEGSLEIPLRDATYWADRPLQTKLYAGTGGYEGGTELAGKPVPVTRGGMDGNHYVQNVPLVQVDTVNLIYQWTDGPGDVQTLYEGGADVFTREANSTNLYSGAPAPGAYRVDVTRGLLQVGSVPVRALTANVSGAFPTAGMKTTAVDIARYVLTELMGQPETELELASWYNADARYPYTAGFFQGPEQVQGLDIVRYLLGSIGARLFTFRNGKLGVAILRKLALDAVPSFTVNRDTAITVDPVPLPAKLDPPPWRWRVGSYRMNLVQTSDFDEAINPVRKTHISQEYPFLSVDQASELKDIWRRPNDPDVVQTALLNVFAAQDLATDMLALWRDRPGLYQITMPYEQSAEMEIGDVVMLDWPLADLDGGKAGQVVGEQVRSYDGTGKIYVLVA